jgi:hypothetical protein
MDLKDLKTYFVNVTTASDRPQVATPKKRISLLSALRTFAEQEVYGNIPLPSVPPPPNISGLLPNQDGQAGKFLTTDSYNLSWADTVPSQATHAGKFLSTDGSTLSWVANPVIPDQASNSGKVLTTNGTSLSWGMFTGLPSQSGSASLYLRTNGTDASWTTMVLNTWANDASRPLNPAVGTVGVNLTSNKVECFINAVWVELH